MNNMIDVLISLIPALVFGIMGGMIVFFVTFIAIYIFCKINDKYQIV